MIGPGNSDEKTILATEQRVPEEDTKIRSKSKSHHSSRGSTPGPAPVDIEIQHAEVQILPSNEAIEPFVSKPADLLDLPKPKEKSPSPFHLEVEEISFANTLDDVATMGTNEVADIDPSMDERPLSAWPPEEDIPAQIPCVKYAEPQSDNEEILESALISNREDPVVEKEILTSLNIGEDIRETDNEQQRENIIDQELSVNAADDKVDRLSHQEEEEEENANINEENNEKYNYEDNADDILENQEQGVGEEARSSDNMPVEEAAEGSSPNSAIPQEKSRSTGSLEEMPGRPSSSIGSSGGVGQVHYDRQYTPLSFSSSDAAFYSPADSQDDSADEKQKGLLGPNQIQVKIVLLFII